MCQLKDVKQAMKDTKEYSISINDKCPELPLRKMKFLSFLRQVCLHHKLGIETMKLGLSFHIISIFLSIFPLPSPY